MHTTSSDLSFNGYLPYGPTVPAQRAQALAHTRQLLQNQFPALTDEQWAALFAEYKPVLWVDEEAQTAVLEEASLVGLANWIHLSQNTGQQAYPPLSVWS